MRSKVKDIMAYKGYTQEKLAYKLGMANQSTLGTRLGHLNSVNNFRDMIEAMDCELIVRSKDGKEWRL